MFCLCPLVVSVAGIALKPTRAGDSFPKFKVLLSLRCRFPFNLHDAICEQILPPEIEREDEEKSFTFIK